MSDLNQPGDIGHGQFADFAIFADATIGPEAMRGSIQTTNAQFAHDLLVNGRYLHIEPDFPLVLPRSSSAEVPIDITATGTLDVAIGAPFDLAYQLIASPIKSKIDFSNTATICPADFPDASSARRMLGGAGPGH